MHHPWSACCLLQQPTHILQVDSAYLLKVPFKMWGWTAELHDLSGAHASFELVKPGAIFPSGCPLSIQAPTGEVITAFRGKRYWM